MMADQTGNSTSPDVHLDDDKHQQGEFVGATLQIDNTAPNRDTPEVSFAGPGQQFDRTARPGSVYGRQSVKSTSSRTSMRPGVAKNEKICNNFFSYKGAATPEDSNFNKAIKLCQQQLKPDLDGPMVGAYLLTEIDHWDNEREKIVILCTNSVNVFKYHFILSKIEEWKRLMLHIIDSVAIGDLKYPEKSLMPDRKHGGIQVRWNRGQQSSFAQRWNPWCNSLPQLTLSHHPLLYNPKESETVTYNVDELYESLIKCISDVYKSKKPGEKVTILEGPILIESYASISSLVFNHSSLGFCMDRNGVCF